MNSLSNASHLHPDLLAHPGYSRVFQPGKLTFGFIMPLEGYAHSPFPTMADHGRMAKMADEAGFSALWMRDVPFYDPNFGDTGQMFDPFVYLGYLAGQTRRIALGTAGIVLPLREPLIVAKQAVSVDQLSGGRLILGLSSGDRAVEYPAFGIDYETRAERYQEGVQLINTVTQNSFPSASSTHFGNLTGAIDLIPKPVGKRIPTLVVGRARQDFSWIAENTDGWMWHLSDFRRLPQLIADWRASWPDATFRPYSYGAFYDIVEDPDAPLQQIGNGVRMGRNALIALWMRQQAEGVSHIALNLKPIRRPAEDVLTELAEHVLPHFRID